MKTTMKNPETNEVYEAPYMLGTIVLVLMFVALVAGSFYMFIAP